MSLSEKQLMLAGEMYDPMHPDLVAERQAARMLFQRINAIPEDQKVERDRLFYDLLGEAGTGLYIEPPFYCDYGYNIKVGESVFMNYNCCILDVCEVTIGNHVMFAPNVQIYTATHPLDAISRNSGRELGKPITIGNDVWIGGGAIICPGVSIGNGAVIGAGAVVTRDVADDCFVAGNPARVVRENIN